MGITVAAILARDISGDDSLSGIPLAFTVAVGAIGAPAARRWMAKSGRRPGLAAGHLIGGVGAAVVVLSAGVESFPLLCLGMAAFGLGNTSNLLARFAATDLAPQQQRARAHQRRPARHRRRRRCSGPTSPRPASRSPRTSASSRAPGRSRSPSSPTSSPRPSSSIFLRPDPLLAAGSSPAPRRRRAGATQALKDLPNWPRLALVGRDRHGRLQPRHGRRDDHHAAAHGGRRASRWPRWASSSRSTSAACSCRRRSPACLADRFGRLPVIAGGRSGADRRRGAGRDLARRRERPDGARPGRARDRLEPRPRRRQRAAHRRGGARAPRSDPGRRRPHHGPHRRERQPRRRAALPRRRLRRARHRRGRDRPGLMLLAARNRTAVPATS